MVLFSGEESGNNQFFSVLSFKYCFYVNYAALDIQMLDNSNVEGKDRLRNIKLVF